MDKVRGLLNAARMRYDGAECQMDRGEWEQGAALLDEVQDKLREAQRACANMAEECYERLEAEEDGG